MCPNQSQPEDGRQTGSSNQISSPAISIIEVMLKYRTSQPRRMRRSITLDTSCDSPPGAAFAGRSFYCPVPPHILQVFSGRLIPNPSPGVEGRLGLVKYVLPSHVAVESSPWMRRHVAQDVFCPTVFRMCTQKSCRHKTVTAGMTHGGPHLHLCGHLAVYGFRLHGTAGKKSAPIPFRNSAG